VGGTVLNVYKILDVSDVSKLYNVNMKR